MSAPAQNALLPAPVIMSARARDFATVAKASSISRKIATESALSASGRLSRSTAQSSRVVSSTDIRGSLSWLGSTDGLGQKLPALCHFDQFTLENLAAGGQRQLAQPDEIFRHVVLGEPLAAKMRDQFRSGHAARHGDADPLAKPSIGDGKAGDPAGPWVA